MEKYLGTKLIEAEPMNKGEAWNRNLVKVDTTNELSQTEFDNLYKTDGYKVVYEDGYESWSPKDVFEKAYRKIKDGISLDKGNWQPHQERVVQEARELREKSDKLESFIIDNPFFIKLDSDEQARLMQQLLAMKYYLTILVERIDNF